ncbi:MAG: acyltransferase [Methylobacteriaceae bacterium]|nr:acyltransferase [Methylobacteriaceae bacterium]
MTVLSSLTPGAGRPVQRPTRDTPRRHGRETGIDALRYVAFLAVVLIHLPSYAVPADTRVSGGAILDQICRFAVPYFFIASGFFLGGSRRPAAAQIARFVGRLLPVFAAWEVVYLVAHGTTWADISDPALWRSTVLRGGPGYHLWYLPSLGVCVTLAILLKDARPAVLLGAGVATFAVGLAFGPYRDWLGLPSIGDTRTGPWFGLVFVLAGLRIRALDLRPALAWCLALVALGIVLQVGEAATLAATGHGRFAPNDFLIGTLPLGIGTFLLARRLPSGPMTDRIGALGRVSLGAYCVHLLFVWLLVGPEQVRIGPWQQPALMAAVATLATLTALALARIPLLDRLVR